jgi:hypothetical protein
MTVRTVRDGARILRFDADVLATATSCRPGAPRWSELVVYRLTRSKEYVVWKVGRSLVAHRPECHRVYPEMPTWLEAGEEAQVHRVPCLECQPEVGNEMDPQTVLEATRYTVLRARDPEQLYRVLFNRTQRPTQLVTEVIDQVRTHDDAFATWLTVTSR